MRFQEFSANAYGRFLHHHPVGREPPGSAARDPMDDQLRRTVIAWSLWPRSKRRWPRTDQLSSDGNSCSNRGNAVLAGSRTVAVTVGDS